jgi:hypothetical protein
LSELPQAECKPFIIHDDFLARLDEAIHMTDDHVTRNSLGLIASLCSTKRIAFAVGQDVQWAATPTVSIEKELVSPDPHTHGSSLLMPAKAMHTLVRSIR